MFEDKLLDDCRKLCEFQTGNEFLPNLSIHIAKKKGHKPISEKVKCFAVAQHARFIGDFEFKSKQ